MEMLNQSQMINHSQLMSIAQPMPVLSQSQQVINNINNQYSHMLTHQLNNQSQSQQRFWMWPPPDVSFNPRNNNNNNRKVNKGIDKRNHNNWKQLAALKELQQHNRVKPKRYISKKRFNNGGKSAPFAPRNTTSFLIRAKKAGGITSLVSPCPVTPAVLNTPVFSPSREVLIDMAKEEWGVDGYGSMKGLIRLKSPENDEESDVEDHSEVERRLDYDLSRFEMISPNYGVLENTNNNCNNSCLLENRVDDQDTHIAQLEEKNLKLKNRLALMEREFDKMRTRLQCLEMRSLGANDSANEGSSELLEENKSSVDNKQSDNGEIGFQGSDNGSYGR